VKNEGRFSPIFSPKKLKCSTSDWPMEVLCQERTRKAGNVTKIIDHWQNAVLKYKVAEFPGHLARNASKYVVKTMDKLSETYRVSIWLPREMR
jgi:hypothetical protein